MWKRSLLFLSVIAIWAFMASRALAVGQTEDVVKSFVAKYQKLFNAGDLDGVVALYLPDAVLMPVDTQAKVGVEPIRVFMKSIFEQWSYELKFDPVEIEVVGNHAILRLEISGTGTSKKAGGPRPLQLVLDPDVGLEIIDFIESNEVKSVVMVDRVIGCPHEEGID